MTCTVQSMHINEKRNALVDIGDSCNRMSTDKILKPGKGDARSNALLRPGSPRQPTDACLPMETEQKLSSFLASESPEPTPMMDTVEMHTCVPSFLQHIGLSKYIAGFARCSIATCGQLILTPTRVLIDIVPCETDRANILCALRDLYISVVSSSSFPALSQHVASSTLPTRLRGEDSTSSASCLSLSTCMTNTTSPSVPATRTSSMPVGSNVSTAGFHQARVISRRQHDPYAFQCIAPEDAHDYVSMQTPNSCDASNAVRDTASCLRTSVSCDMRSNGMVQPGVGVRNVTYNCLIRFKHRQNEYTSTFQVLPGQYVMVSGDRGQDLGLVLRTNAEVEKSVSDRGGPQGSVLRLAFQKEVDYANRTLRAEEDTALEICRVRVRHFGLQLRVLHAEYQYDKRKLTFYYDAQERVDFVALLKDLFREFGCRIWMEKMIASQLLPDV